MDSNIYNKIKIFCKKRKLIEQGDGIVAGISGGADSVFLLEFLMGLKKEMGLRLYVVHVNHGIRGDAAKSDEKLVERIAKENNIDYKCFYADIPKMAQKNHCSDEEMGRLFRYECFERVRSELGFTKIAVAHHMDDQAETVLFQLARGSALRGICGMMPKNGYIIRPLLAVSRAEIESELSSLGIPYALDLTNFEEDYSRNRLRLNVLPYLEEYIQPETVSHISRTAEYMQEIRSYIDSQAQVVFKKIVLCSAGRAEVSVKSLSSQDIVIKRECLFLMMESVCGRRKDLTGKHVEELLMLLDGTTGKRLSLPYKMNAGKDYDLFWISGCDDVFKNKRIKNECQINIQCVRDNYEDGNMLFPDSGCNGQIVLAGEDYHKLSWERKHSINIQGLELSALKEKNSCTKWFDYGKIKNALVFRKPKQGDFLWISPDGGKKKLSRLFIDRKIPISERSKLWVLAEGAHILWVPSLNRGSAYYYVGEGTVEALLINEEGKDT